jgi:hypothetical protein
VNSHSGAPAVVALNALVLAYPEISRARLLRLR